MKTSGALPVIAALAVLMAFMVHVAAASAAENQKPPQEKDKKQTAQEPAKTALPRLVDLGSTKCMQCKRMAPILDELKKEYEGKLTVEFIDVRQNEDAVDKYGIMIIPTQIFFDASGQEQFRHEGFFSKKDIVAKWKELGVDLNKPPAEPEKK